MRYLLLGSVFLHCRQEKLLFKIYLFMAEEHKTTLWLKILEDDWLSSNVPRHQSTQALGVDSRPEIASAFLSFLFFEQTGYNLKNNVMETHTMINVIGCIAAAAKSLQSCLILCDPIDGSPPGSPIPGILQARSLEWVATSFFLLGKYKIH